MKLKIDLLELQDEVYKRKLRILDDLKKRKVIEYNRLKSEVESIRYSIGSGVCPSYNRDCFRYFYFRLNVGTYDLVKSTLRPLDFYTEHSTSCKECSGMVTKKLKDTISTWVRGPSTIDFKLDDVTENNNLW